MSRHSSNRQWYPAACPERRNPACELDRRPISRAGPTAAVFLDALGTLIELEPPARWLRASVPASVPDEGLAAGLRVEMAYYREHAHEGRDAASLAELRDRCAELLSGELGIAVSSAQLLDAVRFRPFPDSAPALLALAGRGLRIVVVSNWDCSLGTVLDSCGLAGLVDGAVSSAECGSRKPDPGIFSAALELAGCEPAHALHVGDTAEEDLAGAAAAGIRALLIERREARPRGLSRDRPAGAPPSISSLAEIVEHL